MPLPPVNCNDPAVAETAPALLNVGATVARGVADKHVDEDSCRQGLRDGAHRSDLETARIRGRRAIP